MFALLFMTTHGIPRKNGNSRYSTLNKTQYQVSSAAPKDPFKGHKAHRPTQKGQCYGEVYLLVFRPGTTYIWQKHDFLGRRMLNFFETTDQNN